MSNNIYNTSHCVDLTAKKALDNIQYAEINNRRARDLIGCLLRISSLAGFEVVADIEIKNRATGEIYSSREGRRHEDSRPAD